MEHELARGALDMDSRRNGAHHRDSPVWTAAPSMLLDAFSPRTYDTGVQG